MVVISIEKFKLKKLEKKMADKNFMINSYVDNLLDVTWTLNNLRHKLKDIPDGDYLIARIEMAFDDAKGIKRQGYGTAYSDTFIDD